MSSGQTSSSIDGISVGSARTTSSDPMSRPHLSVHVPLCPIAPNRTGVSRWIRFRPGRSGQARFSRMEKADLECPPERHQTCPYAKPMKGAIISSALLALLGYDPFDRSHHRLRRCPIMVFSVQRADRCGSQHTLGATSVVHCER